MIDYFKTIMYFLKNYYDKYFYNLLKLFNINKAPKIFVFAFNVLLNLFFIEGIDKNKDGLF